MKPGQFASQKRNGWQHLKSIPSVQLPPLKLCQIHGCVKFERAQVCDVKALVEMYLSFFQDFTTQQVSHFKEFVHIIQKSPGWTTQRSTAWLKLAEAEATCLVTNHLTYRLTRVFFLVSQVTTRKQQYLFLSHEKIPTQKKGC